MQGGLNVLISGGTGSGKTTCLNALGTAIAGAQERVVTIEETQELQLESMLPDCVALQARLPNVMLMRSTGCVWMNYAPRRIASTD